jgi:Relaxase/Mobilisation nuclease domain
VGQRLCAGRPSTRRLAELLEQPLRSAGNPPSLPVWHCSVHNHPDDPVLSDQQWEHAAAEIVARVGLAPRGDLDAVRWIGIRHADNHIHILATQVRQDGRTAWTRYDYTKAQAACRDLERHFGLRQVGRRPAATRRPKPAELNKANRQHRDEVPRHQLVREVRAAATTATDEHDFITRLRVAGLLIRTRTSTTSGTVTGYAVALPDHHTAAGNTIWYSGARLAADLATPQLQNGWQTT